MSKDFVNTLYNKTINLYKKTINGNISNKNNWIVNISNKDLSDDERNVLLLGLNFSISQGCILKIDIYANIEKGIKLYDGFIYISIWLSNKPFN